MTLKHPAYWHVKSAVLTLQLARQMAEANVKAAEQNLRLVMSMNSLDPDVSYAMNDAEETFTPQEPPQVIP